MRSFITILLLLAVVYNAMSQAIEPANASMNGWARLVYENDLFHHTDRYYTQGLRGELAAPTLQQVWTRYLLPLPKAGTRIYGLAIEHDVYTPTSIASDSILYGDRPFAAAIMATTFGMSYDSLHHRTTRAALTAGIMGPAAGGREMQTYIHSHTGNLIPHGWQYQLHNSLIFNYQLTAMQRLLSVGHILHLTGNVTADLGTLSTKTGLGATLAAGLLPGHRHIALYATCTPTLYAVGYNGTLQGGLGGGSSPYTIPASRVDRLVFQNRLCFTAQVKNLSLSYTSSYITREFKGGTAHAWGGLDAVLTFWR